MVKQVEAVYLDTHIVVWLRQNNIEKFSKTALNILESSALLLVSPMVLLELKFLQEIKRINDEPQNIINDLNAMIELQVDDIGLRGVITQAMSIDWTRDPFDRLIVAQATAKDRPLLTKDAKILKHFNGAIW